MQKYTGIRSFLPATPGIRQFGQARLSGHKEAGRRLFWCAAARYYVFTNAHKATPMKPSLHLKIIIVLTYVALCTLLVLAEQQSDSPGQSPQLPLSSDYE